MSEESTTPHLADLLRRATEAVNRRDFDAVMSFYAPDAAFDVSRTLFAELHGQAAVRGIFEEWMDRYEEFEVQPEARAELGNGVLFSVMRQAGRPRGSTGRVEQRELWVYLFVDGVVAKVTIYPYTDIDEARADAERLAEPQGDS
jgi:ketosteroid isomerase-like protein